MHHGGVRRYVSDLAATWPIDERRLTTGDATVLVADVSGFTRLSERLATLGAEGTEAVKDIINSIFEPCLDQVLRHEGDVIKFAGDGFLALYEGRDHATRAARSAAAMQRVVRDLESFRTPAGRVRPRLTIGAETGDITALMLGQGPRNRCDVVVTGAAVDAAFTLDSAAAPGQVRLGANLVSALPPGWSWRIRGGTGQRLRIAAVPELVGHGARRLLVDEQARQFLDPAVVAAIESGQSPAEHRTITVAFVVIDDIGRRWQETGPTALTEQLNDIAATVATACRRHDVCWLESDSEHDRVRLLLTVGAPIRRENDTERLVAAVHDIGERHAVRTGVARGRAFVGDVGHHERRTYNVMGPVVNLAARIAGSAPAESVVLTADVAALVDGSFETADAPALTLKGVADPVEVARLQGLRAAPIKRDDTRRLHGRIDELRTIADRIDDLSDSGGAAVEIVAEAGLGKSRLVDAIESTASVDVHRANGRRDRQTIPYAAVSSLVRGVLGISSDLTPEEAGYALLDRVERAAPHLLPLAPLVAAAAHASVPDTAAADAVSRPFRSPRTVEVIVELLAAVRHDPTIFIAEDVHWFDDASRLILIGLTAIELPWMVLATRRPDAVPLEGFETLPLRPLAGSALHATVSDAIGDAAMSRRQLADIVAASAGNPLFARELVLAATDGGAGRVPDRIEGIIGARIDHLDFELRLMLRDLSVTGMESDSAIVESLLDEHGLGDEVLALMHHFVVVTGHGVRFRHDLYRRAAYEGLSVKRRRELHGRLAGLLAGRPDAASQAGSIAEHAHHAGDATTTWLWARTAAAEALEQGATHEAAVHLQRALETTDSLEVGPSEEARIAEMLGDALELAGRPADAHASYRRARRVLSGDPVEQARLCRKHARVDERAGRYRAALRWSTQGLKLLDGRDPGEIAAELQLAAGVVRFFQGRFEQAITLAHAAIDAADGPGAAAVLAQAHLQLEMAYSELGLKSQRAQHGARALELFEELDDRLGLANLHLNLGVSEYNEANWREAITHYERSARDFRLVGDTIGAEAARNNQAEILTDQGRLDQAAEILTEVERALRAARYPIGVAMTTSGRARIALRQGDPAGAADLLDAARSAFVDLDARHMVLDTDVRRVEHLVWAGQADDAEELAGQVRRELTDVGPVAVLPATLKRLRGWAALQLSDVESAHAHFRGGLSLAQEESFDYEVALALDALIASGARDVTDAERQQLDDLVRDLDITRVPRPPWLPTDSDR